MVVRFAAWIPRSLLGWAVAVVSVCAIGYAMLFVLYGPNWPNLDYNYAHSSDGLIVTAVVALAVGSWLGTVIERPYVMRQRESANLAAARLEPHERRFGPGTANVDAVLAGLGLLPAMAWWELMSSYADAKCTTWFRECMLVSLPLFRDATNRGQGQALVFMISSAAGEIERAIGELVSMPENAEPQVPGMARIMAATAILYPGLSEQSRDLHWRPFESVLPRRLLFA